MFKYPRRVVTKPPGGQGLSIGDLARRTGVPSSTLRMWETRYGFPTAHRTPSGHRRYDEVEVERIESVLRRKAAGLRMHSAVAEVTRGPGGGSVFAELRRLHPALTPRVLRKRTLTALTHAMEDEACARAQRPWLFGSFQREEFYRRAEARWRDFAATGSGAWALADFAAHAVDRSPVEVAVPAGSTLHREWSLVCLAEDLSVCVSGWELPGQEGGRDDQRRFETVWSVDPAVVRDAAGSCARTIQDLGVATDLWHVLDAPGYSASAELARATTVFNRIVAYVDRSSS